MRILVLQLARFGDVYQTWPTLNALKRTHPGAEVHVLVRRRFRDALVGLPGVIAHELATADVLAPIYADGDEVAAHARLVTELDRLAAIGFDRIVNLSFSPLSSFVTDYLGEGGARVSGYARHADGFFNPVDDVSAYFYAQVGVGRPNRFHVTELFAGVAGVDLIEDDYRAGAAPSARAGLVVHLGASRSDKTYPPERWADALVALRQLTDEAITLIGSAAESPLADAVTARADVTHLTNLVGRTRVPEVMDVVARARLLIGADSAPAQMASLTGTPVLNLSGAEVNFWETGPLSRGSRVLYAPRVADHDPARVAAEAAAMLNGRAAAGPCFERPSPLEPFVPYGRTRDDDFAWGLIQALYVGTPYPETDLPLDLTAFQRLHEVAELAVEQLARWDGPGQTAAAHQLQLIDDILPQVAALNPRIEPLTQWFQTQRLRLGPAAPEVTLKATRALFEELRVISAVYHRTTDLGSTVGRAVAIGRDIAPRLREFDFVAVEARFNELISVLHELAARSTKVGMPQWSALVPGLGAALSNRDFIELADRLEYELPRELETLVPELATLSG